MLKICMIRHGKTLGNEEGRFIGITDDELSPAGIESLEKKKARGVYPDADAVYSSPMKRCLQSAKIIYPSENAVVMPLLAEYKFGIFEGKNHQDLEGTPFYQKFLESDGRIQIPGAPSIESFREGCVRAFEEILSNHTQGDISIICHGGTIMAIMQYILPKDDLYFYHVDNGEAYIVVYEHPAKRCRSIALI